MPVLTRQDGLRYTPMSFGRKFNCSLLHDIHSLFQMRQCHENTRIFTWKSAHANSLPTSFEKTLGRLGIGRSAEKSDCGDFLLELVIVRRTIIEVEPSLPFFQSFSYRMYGRMYGS